MPDGSFDIIVAPEPFNARVETATVPAGTSIAQMLTVACNSGTLDPQDLARAEIYINGELIEDRLAGLDLIPLDGDIINVVVMPQGGRGGEKALETALQLAIMVAAFAVAGPGGALASQLAAAGISGAVATGIEVASMAAINLVGDFALSSIFGNLNKPTTTNPTYNLESQSNQSRQREPMPLQCGQSRVALDVAASAYNSIINNVQYITAIYGCHFGPCTVDLIKIGETLASAYPSSELTIEYFLTPGARQSSLYPSKIDQQSFQNELDPLHATPTVETTGVDPCTSFEIDLYWPALFYTSSGGAQEDEQSKVLIQYSPHGANTWAPIPGLPAGTDKSGDAFPAGTFFIVANQRNPLFKTIAFTLASGQYDIQVSRSIRPGGDTSRDTDDVYWTALRSIDTSTPAIADETLSVIVLRAQASQDFDGTLGTVSAVVTPIVPQFNATTNAWMGDPTTYDATNWQPSLNAAEIARYMLTGYPAAFPLLASEIDATFGTQAALITTMGWTGGFTQNQAATQADVLGKIGKLGRCTFFWDGAAMRCIPDYEKPVGRQAYTGRNAKSYSYKRVFPDPVHAVWVEFSNADEDWKQDGLFVYNDGYTSANATLLEKLTLDYACVTTRAYKEGRVYLAKRTLLSETHAWTCGIESVTNFYGDRVIVRHNSTSFGIGEARVLFRRMSGALVAGVRLDTAVTFAADTAYAIDARRSDQLLRSLALTTSAGTTRDLVFSTPLIATQAPEAGDLVIIGEVNIVTEDVELIDVSPQADGTAKLTAQAYRWDDIVAAETGAVPALQSLLTPRQAAPVPTILGASGDPNGVTVSFTVQAQRQATIKGFSAQYRRSPDEDSSSTWTTLPLLAPNATSVTTPPIPQAQYQPGDTASEYNVDVQICSVLSTGEVSQPAQALNIVVQQGVYAPTDFAALGVTRSAPDGSSYPAIQISCDPVTNGGTTLLQIELSTNGTTWSASASGPFHADNPDGDLTDVKGGQTYSVRGRFQTSDGWNSVWVTLTGISVPTGALVAANTTNVGALTSAAVATGIAAAQTAAANAQTAAAAAQAAAASALSDITTADATLTTSVAAAQSAANTALSDAAAANTDLAAEITRAEGAEGTLSTSIANLTSTVSGNTSAISAEALTRSTADSALSALITSLTSTVTSNNSTLTASISTEAGTRATADNALSSQLATLTSTVNGNTAAISSNNTTLTDSLSALSTTVSNLTATVTGNNTSQSAALSAEAIVRADADSALSAQITSLTSTVDGSTSSSSTDYSTLSTSLSALSSTVTALSATVTSNNSAQTASLNTEATTRADADTALSNLITTLNSSLAGLSATVTSNNSTLTTAQAATAASVTTLQSQIYGAPNLLAYGDFEDPAGTGWTGYGAGWVIYEDPNFGHLAYLGYVPGGDYLVLNSALLPLTAGQTYTLSGNIQALVATTSAVGPNCYLDIIYCDASGAQVAGGDGGQNDALYTLSPPASGPNYKHTETAPTGTTQGFVRLVAEPNASGVAAWAQRIMLQQGSVATAYSAAGTLPKITAALSTEATTRAAADGALSALITSLTATVGANTSAISSEAITRAAADSALSASISSLTSTVSGNAAAISSEAVTRADADTALSNLITSLTSTVAGNTASISSNYTTLSGEISSVSSAQTSLSSTVSGLSATVSSQATTVADSASKLAVARFTLQTAASGGAPALMSITSDSDGGSNISLVASQVFLGANIQADEADNCIKITDGSGNLMVELGQLS